MFGTKTVSGTAVEDVDPLATGADVERETGRTAEVVKVDATTLHIQTSASSARLII